MIKIKDTTIRVVRRSHAALEKERAVDLKDCQGLFSEASLIAKEEKLRIFYRAALVKAQKSKRRSLYFMVHMIPAFPCVGLTRVVTQEIHRFLTRNIVDLREIVIVAPDEGLAHAFKKEAKGYLSHLLRDLAGEPYVTVDVIIELPQGIVVIERSNPPFGWALPGGFVDKDESLEMAVRREAMEETHLKLKDLRQFYTYSDPKRDPRFHTIDTVFIAQGVGAPRFGDDAKGLKIVPYKELLSATYAFDHKDIIRQYLRQRKQAR